MLIINPRELRKQRNKGKKTHVLTWVIFVGVVWFLGLHTIALVMGILWGLVVAVHLAQ